MDNISSQSDGTRLPYFDVLKLFAIFLVLWGHCIQYFLSSQYSDEPVYRYIYSFHMPLFMMISGYFSASSMKLRFTELITKKSRQLLLPCVSWAIIFTIIASTRTNQLFINTLTSSLIYGFWFLKSCFIFYLLYHCTLRLQLQAEKTYMDYHSPIYQPTNPLLSSTFNVSGIFNRIGIKKFRKIYTNDPTFLLYTHRTFYRFTLFLGRNFLAKTQFTDSINKHGHIFYCRILL